ncbi:spore coat U domain-containing protein [Acinetobacter sp. neg1]|uniref:Csu type fimbrial protein n=1 Tax=Acinetobacter sp. neg1 TaxID=1561068 RepID=UPI0006455A79|nr:spore coat U domain-containing protein [Acinetobacter sp. neg1]
MKNIFLITVGFVFFNQVCFSAIPQTRVNLKIQAKIEKGCSLTNKEYQLDFGRHPSVSQEKVTANVINNSSSWNLKCTENMPVNISINGGENVLTSIRRMKHLSSSDYINYKLYNSFKLDGEYEIGKVYSLQPTTVDNSILNFSIYGVADLSNNNLPREAGIYRDTVSILIAW